MSEQKTTEWVKKHPPKEAKDGYPGNLVSAEPNTPSQIVENILASRGDKERGGFSNGYICP
ncbi:MAG: hypothetical protein COV36_02145 [Alphaproteobacteria bacterium CG11_big_fil_rev_8_21_14_0_20_44_7]|nr:MAG: hypothetical protein COV36_02145 [Alphaproteobacteria bacterium CG11_big_fil_rev_8_21_14_0_20_44_7]